MDLQMKYGKWAPLSARLGPLLSRGAEAAAAATALAEDGFLGFSVAEVLMDLPDGRKGIWLQGWAGSSSSGSTAERRKLAYEDCRLLPVADLGGRLG